MQDLENKLVDYIDARRDMPFAWGPNDCVSFSNGAMNAIRGFGFGDHWIGRYKTALGARRVFDAEKKRGGYSGIIDAIDDVLMRVKFPSRGSIVAREMKSEFFGYRIGVCVGPRIAFVSENGLVFEYLDFDDIAWAIE